MTQGGKKLALVLGVAAGATIAMFAAGKTGKKAVQYVSRKTSGMRGKVAVKKEKLDDSETFYV